MGAREIQQLQEAARGLRLMSQRGRQLQQQAAELVPQLARFAEKTRQRLAAVVQLPQVRESEAFPPATDGRYGVCVQDVSLPSG